MSSFLYQIKKKRLQEKLFLYSMWLLQPIFIRVENSGSNNMSLWLLPWRGSAPFLLTFIEFRQFLTDRQDTINNNCIHTGCYL